MPLQLRSRTATDTARSRSPSPLATPTPKQQVPTICLTTATPCDPADDARPAVSRMTSKVAYAPIAPKSSAIGDMSRKRLVPKKSKLSLLGSSVSVKTRESDVARDLGPSSGVEIYVDPTNDPDIGEILMVKKKKSRLGLDGLEWGTLGEVTNVPSIAKPKEKRGKRDSILGMKADENQKWWSIGRGRKDSKEKEKGKDKERAKSPPPTVKPADARTRFNSLSSGVLLSKPMNVDHSKSSVENSRAPTPPSGTAPSSAAGLGNGKDSVALRAMRSVRSLARIGSWAQLKNTPDPDAPATVAAPVKDKESDGKKKKKKKDKDKGKEKEKDKTQTREETIRYLGSSFEAGALTASPSGSRHESKSLGKKKTSILGLGLPSTIRLPSSRSGSTASSVVAANTVNNRSSIDSANLLGGGILARGRSGSAMSTVSSLRPLSAISRQSSDSSGAASVRWDEAGLQTAREIRRKEKESKRKEEESKEKKKSKSKKSKSGRDSTRKSLESRKRIPLAGIFSGVSEHEEVVMEQPQAVPIVTARAEAADSPTETPVKRVRPRPVSEYSPGQGRLKPFVEGNDDHVAISLLDAATNDLAQLINRLDLEATPGSVEATPNARRSPFAPEKNLANDPLTAESPVKNLRRKNSSIASLRSFAQSCSKSVGARLGQNIAPWSTLNASISPSKPSPSTIRVKFQDNMATVRTHRQTVIPAPATDPSPVFKALRPATTRLPISKKVVSTTSGVSPFVINPSDRPPSTWTFGSSHSKAESCGSLSFSSNSPVFKKAHSRTRTSSSTPDTNLDSRSLPILPEARRSLGLAGTLGGSIGSIAEQDDGSDPDSDIPDELQVILSNSDQDEDTISFNPKREHLPPPSPGLPPELPLPELNSQPLGSSFADIPVFRAPVAGDEHHADIEETGTPSEDDTKKSFDFTGELRKLNKSGVSHRHSFIEQLENAFRTPNHVDLQYDFGDLPPIPKLPTLQDELSQVGENSFDLPIDSESRELSPRGFPMDVNVEPTLLPRSNSFVTTTADEELLDILASQPSPMSISIASRPSNGKLNRDFKFGGKHSKNETLPLTLSDIIPPPEIALSLSMASSAGGESSLMRSILAHAVKIDSPPQCLQSEIYSSSKSEARDAPRKSPAAIGHQRNDSVLSFGGLDSFAEIRRGFEFNDSRPGFYPPPATVSDTQQRKHESIYSIASVSSYGNVLHGGSADPFDYASFAPLPSLRERPSSDNFSFTMSIDDTFSFIRRQPPRRRVDSDASSFYFRPSVALAHPYSRSQRRPDSGMSFGPPISILNRNSTYHHRDSSISLSSIGQMHTNCQRFSWSRHRSNASVESLVSDSETNIGRPGLGDKMLDSALERGAPLASISASPTQSLAGSVCDERLHSRREKRMSYDSVMDGQYETQRTDSLFEKTRNRNSVCSTDSMFFEQDVDNAAAKPPRYRPISSLSIPSVHSPPKEDDTMISMLGGGHVRRLSVTSMIGSSPCIQAERRKNILDNPPETVFSRIQKTKPEDHNSPPASHILETKPSIASTATSSAFGDERMIRAQHGLLERQSPEETALVGNGEDLSGSFRLPVFTRPNQTNRSRSSTCTSSSGAETPPLSISDGYSSFSDGSLSSIDLSQLNVALSNATHPLSNAAFDRARPPARGHRHRHRISQARASRTSIYEIIEEELNPQSSTDSPETSICSTSNTPKIAQAGRKSMDPPQVYVVDSETSSVDSVSLWDDERGITALRRYYALRDEAEDAITESKRTWLDTPLSSFAIQSFDPPRHPSGIQAMLQHSLQNYGPLPSELRPHRIRSRANSRPSPYPRTIKTSFTSSPSTEHLRATVAASLAASNAISPQPSPFFNGLQQITINPNVPSRASTGLKGSAISPDKPERLFGLPPLTRIASPARRGPSGWSKKSTGRNGAENKENATVNIRVPTAANMSQGTMATPSDGLRRNRPRPRGRPTLASKPIRA